MVIQSFHVTRWLSISKYCSQWCVPRAPPRVPGWQRGTVSHHQHHTLSNTSSSSSNINKNNNINYILRPLHLTTFSHTQVFGHLQRPFDRSLGSSASNAQVLDLNDLSIEEKIQLVKYEFELLKEEGEVDLPTEIKEKHWNELVAINGPAGRKKFYRYLFLTEMSALNSKKKKEGRRLHAKKEHERVSHELESSDDNHISYGLWRNCFMLKINNQTVNNGYNNRLINARLFGQPIVFDDDFDSHMTPREKKELGRQMSFCLGLTRSYLDPFYIHICNFDQQHGTAQSLIKTIPSLDIGSFPVDTHKNSYTEIFPRDKLVYLTPDAKEEMSTFDHDAVYIIGNLVDKGSTLPLSMAKAKREGIKMQSLPLDRYLDWGIGRKCLTLNQVLGIMLEMKHHGSWVKALEKNIPKRKLIKPLQEDGPSIKRKMMRHKLGLHDD